MEYIHTQFFKTSYGELILGSYKEQLCLCDWRYRKMRPTIDKRIKTGLNSEYLESSSDIIDKTITQLTEYFKGNRKDFNIPLLFIGTEFQKDVWNELIKVPYSETETYLGLSKRLDNEKAIRAVASANGANSIAILVPCHRIIGSNGELVGYAGGLSSKRKLLNLEGYKKNGQTELFKL